MNLMLIMSFANYKFCRLRIVGDIDFGIIYHLIEDITVIPLISIMHMR